jgi:hypothetical protein
MCALGSRGKATRASSLSNERDVIAPCTAAGPTTGGSVSRCVTLLLMAIVGGIASSVGRASATDLLLRWTTSAGAEGYRLYVGPQSRLYTSAVDVGLLPGGTVDEIVYFLVPGLRRGNSYFFAATAYNSWGESDYSNEKEIVVDSVSAPAADAGPDQTGAVGQAFSLGVNAADDANYIWLQRAGPPGSLVDPHHGAALFAPDAPGIFEFLLTAYDGQGFASTDLVRIEVVAGFSPTPTPTRSPTPSATATPKAPGFCSGDLRQDAPVTVADVVKGVNIALGALLIDRCPALDFDVDGRVTIDELIEAVNRALSEPASS